MLARLTRFTHRIHRTLGSILGVLLFAWFASGAVMLFHDFPRLSERESLEHSQPLKLAEPLVLGGGTLAWLASPASRTDEPLRLRMLEGRPTWLFRSADGTARAERADTGRSVSVLDVARARQTIARGGFSSPRSIERLTDPDQWSVGLFTRGGLFPLFRVELTDRVGTELYLCEATGELVQMSTRRERIAAWFGAIPHWIYPTLLRRHREGWRTTVLVLAALGLGATLSGLLAGIHVNRVLRRSRPARRLRDPLLRWHQRLGLVFGAVASTWVLSGALSLAPFHWTDRTDLYQRVFEAVHAGAALPAPSALTGAVALCRREVDVRELQIVRWAGGIYAVCVDSTAATRIVDLAQADASPRALLEPAALARVAAALGISAPISLSYQEDDCHYRTWRAPQIAMPFVRAELSQGATLYLDPARARVLALHTAHSRLERWLYHGLHSLDFPTLYRRRGLWLACMLAAMSLGALLSGLGVAMLLRRAMRHRHQRDA